MTVLLPVLIIHNNTIHLNSTQQEITDQGVKHLNVRISLVINMLK